jgi:hypothetical protein
VNSGSGEYFDDILDALAFNSTVETLELSHLSEIHLNDPNSLKFLEKNQSIKTLNLGNVDFEKEQMIAMGEALKNNDSITELNFSFSNFSGSFKFLQKSNFKIFKFQNIWQRCASLKDFVDNLKLNQSIIKLDVSSYLDEEELTEVPEMHELIDVLSVHKRIEDLTWKEMKKFQNEAQYHKLLKNKSLKSLNLNHSLKSSKLFFKELKNNQNLTFLDISSKESWIDLENFKINNDSIETLIINGFSKIH